VATALRREVPQEFIMTCQANSRILAPWFLSPTRNACLKAQAQRLKATLKVGKEGLSPQFLAALDDALKHRELVKVKFDDFKEQKKELAPQLAEKSGSAWSPGWQCRRALPSETSGAGSQDDASQTTGSPPRTGGRPYFFTCPETNLVISNMLTCFLP